MRAVVQRVRSASVTVGSRIAGRIDTGLLALVGIAPADGAADVEYMAQKLGDVRLFPDEQGRMNRSVMEMGGALLVVSQFTLLADCRKGRRPSFDAAARPTDAEARYQELVDALRARGIPVETGVFGADMQVQLVNDGPVTVLLDSTRLF